MNVPVLLRISENDYDVFIFVIEGIVVIQNLYESVRSDYLLDVLVRIIGNF